MDRTLSGASTPGQSWPGSKSNKGVLRIPQNSNISGASPLNCFVSYPGHSLGKSYLSADIQSVYSTALADWATGHSLEETYPSPEMQSVYSTALADRATGHWLAEYHPSPEIQSVYSTALADWATGHSLEESYPSPEMCSAYSTPPDHSYYTNDYILIIFNLYK